MDLLFPDPDVEPLPPEEVRIQNITLDPFPDGCRIRVDLELTPFLMKPHGEIQITDQSGRIVAETSFIEAVTPKFEMILHLKSFDPDGEYLASITLFYSQEVEDEVVDGRTLVSLVKNIVDQKRVNFKILQT
jgi:hypothetical protein